MIIELYGLPASGKSTHARAYEKEGAIRIRAPRGFGLVLPALIFCGTHPVRALVQLWFLMRYAHPGERYSLFVNIFLGHAAKWQRAAAVSRSGLVALIDQGHHQNLLSLFSSEPSVRALSAYQRSFPRPDVLLAVICDESVRRERAMGRPEAAALTSERRAVAEEIFLQTLSVVEAARMPLMRIDGQGQGTLASVLSRNVTYVSAARMPTEKAHGISIAQLCAGFSALGALVTLLLPSRRNVITSSVATYYGVSDTFSVETVKAPDFLGSGMRHPFFFFLQRLLFVSAAVRKGIAPGTVYTREPETVFAFCRSHRTVYEAHRWPKGIAGRLTAHMLRNVSLVVCNSRGTEEAVHAAGIERTVIAPNGFDPALFIDTEDRQTARARLGISPETPVALYIGLLSGGKGVETFFRAAAQLAPDIQTVVIGGSEGEVATHAKRYPEVRFLGYRPYTEIGSNLAAADVLVLPNTRTDAESTTFTSPIKLFSYMASGIPIVASDVPAVRETLSKGEAWFVAPDSPEALAEGIRTALARKEDSRAMAARALLKAKDYTWHMRAARILTRLTTTL